MHKSSKFPNGYWDIHENRLNYMTWLQQKLKFQNMSDWYNIKTDDFIQNGGKTLLKKYNDSPLRVLMSVYPEYQWQPWRFGKTTSGYWKEDNNVAEYMQWLANQLNITCQDDWYSIKKKDFIENYGTTLLKRFNNSPKSLLESFFNLNRNWDQKSTMEWMDALGKKLNFKYKEDWYKLKYKDLERNGGREILKKLGSPAKVVMYAYPNYEWQWWRFQSMDKDIWDDHKSAIQYLNWLKDELGYRNMDDWYKISKKNFSQNGGAYLLKIYNNSPAKLLATIYPEREWQVWKFRCEDGNIWEDSNNALKYANWLMEVMGWTSMENWYEIRKEDLIKRGGSSLLKKYGGSTAIMVMSIFPGQDWKEWRFAEVPKGFFSDPNKLRTYFEEVGSIIGIHSQEDWENASPYLLLSYGLKDLLKEHGTLQEALKFAYPERQWNFSGTSKGQTLLKQYIHRILEEYKYEDQVQENVRISNLRHSNSNRPVELDLYIPSMSLAFEYHGSHHYKQTHRGDLSKQITRDEEKVDLCRKANITLIRIPYKWSGNIEDLKATIAHYRSDFFPNGAIIEGQVIHPVPSNSPQKSSKHMPSFMLPSIYKPIMDPTGW
jgi:hypothetical protein